MTQHTELNPNGETVILAKATLAWTGKALFMHETFGLVRVSLAWKGKMVSILGEIAAKAVSQLGMSNRLG